LTVQLQDEASKATQRGWATIVMPLALSDTPSVGTTPSADFDRAFTETVDFDGAFTRSVDFDRAFTESADFDRTLTESMQKRPPQPGHGGRLEDPS